MADATVGALRVTLGADTASFEDGLKRAQSSLSTFSKNVGTIAAGIGLEKIIENTMDFVVHTFKEGFQRIDAIGKEAQKTGIGVEAFSGLMLSAELADVSMQTLSTSLGKLAKNMVDTAKGTGDAQNTFNALGISVKNTDGTMKSADQVLIEIAGTFEKTADGANKTATAIALFGKNGKDLIPLLNEGATGLQDMRKRAEEMGLVISQNTANSVQAFNDNLKILAKTKEGLVNLVIEGVIPALVRLSNQLVESSISSGALKQSAGFLIDEFKGIVSAAFEVVAVIKGLQEIYDSFRAVIANVNTELHAQSAERFKESFANFPALLQAARDSAEALFSSLSVGGKKATDELDVGMSKVSTTIANFNLRAAELRGNFSQFATGFATMAVQLKLTDENASSLSKTVEGLTPAQRQLNDAMLNFQGAKMAQDALDPWQKLQKQIEVVNTVIASGKPTLEEIALLQKKVALDSQKVWEDTAAGVVGAWDKTFQLLAQQNSAFATAAKATAIAMAIINTAQGVTKALAELGPFAPFAIPAILAAGAVQIAVISGVKFAKGGSFQVGGGLTNVDSQMVAFRATPGELVDVRRPGQTAGGVQTINLGLPSANDFFSQHVRQMVTALNKAAPDGYVLKVAS